MPCARLTGVCRSIVEVPLAWDSLQANISTVTEISPNIDWTLFISVILWNYQGWDMLGCMAGEVKNAKRTYPVGVTLAILFLTFTYLVPVMVGVSVTPGMIYENAIYLLFHLSSLLLHGSLSFPAVINCRLPELE